MCGRRLAEGLGWLKYWPERCVYSQNMLIYATFFEPAGRPKSLDNIFTGGHGWLYDPQVYTRC